MDVLVGEIIKNNSIFKVMEVPYNNRKEFFVALVSISDSLGVDVPLWTFKEDKLLKEGEKVTIIIDKDMILNIYKKVA